MNYLFQNGDLALRLMQDAPEEYERLLNWLSDRRVAAYYDGLQCRHTQQSIRQKYGPRVRGEEEVTPCIAEYEKRPIGYMQFYPVVDNYDCRGLVDFSSYKRPMAIDMFVGEPDLWNKGIGSSLLCCLCAYLAQSLGVDAVFIDPKTENVRAIRCYRKAGFVPVCVIPKREEMDGKLWDNLILCWQGKK